jgi:hypothetical protein
MERKELSEDEARAHGSLLLRLLIEYGDEHKITPQDMTAIVISIGICMETACQKIAHLNRVVH